MVRWYYKVNFGIFEAEITSSMDLSGLGKYTEIEDAEWQGLKQAQTDVQIIINNPENNHPMLYTDEEIVRKKTQEKLREQRRVECFPIVDRGQMWYDHYVNTDERKAELKAWYEAWLVVTETLVVPTKPEWLDNDTTADIEDEKDTE